MMPERRPSTPLQRGSSWCRPPSAVSLLFSSWKEPSFQSRVIHLRAKETKEIRLELASCLELYIAAVCSILHPILLWMSIERSSGVQKCDARTARAQSRVINTEMWRCVGYEALDTARRSRRPLDAGMANYLKR